MLLKDKVVIVSGIGPGLGQELALEAARQGAKVAMCARTPAKLDDAEKLIREAGLSNELLKVPTDISSREQCAALVAATVERFGRIEVLFNSAYVPGAFTPIAEADLGSWREAMDVNFFGTMGLTLEAVPHMRKQGGGAVVMINTMVTRKPMPSQAGYGASKAALANATSHLALELGPDNIRVNSAFMGWMWGPSVEGYFKMAEEAGGPTVEQQKAAVAANIPLRRIPDDADCAKAAIFLGSDYAHAVTGAALDVNGGEYLPH